jgi:hypothetical protein
MAKRKALVPWPDGVWHSSGRVRNTRAVRVIGEHLQKSVESGALARLRTFTPDGDYSRYMWGFDASWQTQDGARVNSRLVLAPDDTVVTRRMLSQEALEKLDISMDVSWTLTAEADGPWNPEWPSPMTMMFGDRYTYDWVSGGLSLNTSTVLVKMRPELLQEAVGDLVKKTPWYITVLTHDTTPLGEIMGGAESPDLADMLPPSLVGRVVEIRVAGTQDQIVNQPGVMPESRLQLRYGGALIVPSRPYSDSWALTDGIVRRPPGGGMEQLLKETAVAVTRYAALGAHLCDRAKNGVETLRASWVLPEIALAPKRVLDEKQMLEERLGLLETELRDVRSVLDDERSVAARVREERSALEGRVKELEERPLAAQAAEAQAQADEAQAVLETYAAELESLASEVAWLRRERATTPGQSYSDPAPQRPDGPESWPQLLELAQELLTHVQILDSVRAPLQKLYGHRATRTWLRRTWESLEVLEAYAEAKARVGADVLPHFTAYLDWPEATVLIPKGMFAASEVTVEHGGSDLRVRRTRMFLVPGLGEVFMGAHMRIGQHGSPAPRMHFLDDTSGPTGKVHVGYIGPHLPNAKGR